MAILKIIGSVLGSLLLAFSLNAQTCYIYFDYDEAGNRVKRYEDCPVDKLKKQDDTIDQSVEAVMKSSVYKQTSKYDEWPNKYDEQIDNDLIVFPNPTDGAFTLRKRGAEPESKVYILNSARTLIRVRSLGDGRFNISGRVPGPYFVLLEQSGSLSSKILIKTDSKTNKKR